MGDTIELGFQAALVSLHSPTFGRLWLANELHPGDTVSMTQAQALVLAAEKRTGRRPWRRTDLLTARLAKAKAARQVSQQRLDQSVAQHQAAQGQLKEMTSCLSVWETEVKHLKTEYQTQHRQPTSHCQLSRAERKVAIYTARLPRCQKTLTLAERRLTRHIAQLDDAQAVVDRLQPHFRQCLVDNAANRQPIRATFRLDGGFASQENMAWIIEMGYDLFTRGRSTPVRARPLRLKPIGFVWALMPR